ncbi:MAG: hypothetical protein ACR2HH_15750 [Chthoniobacterales bacterium]
MFLAVLGVREKYNGSWAALTAIADMVTRLDDLTTGMQESSGVQGTKRTGIAGGKRRQRLLVMDQAVAIAGDLHALAGKNNDADLQAKCAFELTDLVRLGETVIAPRCQEIHDLANTNTAGPAAFGGVIRRRRSPLFRTPFASRAVASRYRRIGNHRKPTPHDGCSGELHEQNPRLDRR